MSWEGQTLLKSSEIILRFSRDQKSQQFCPKGNDSVKLKMRVGIMMSWEKFPRSCAQRLDEDSDGKQPLALRDE